MPVPPQPDNIPENFEPVKVTGTPAKKPAAPRKYRCYDPEGQEFILDASIIRDWEGRGRDWRVGEEVTAKGKAPAPAVAADRPPLEAVPEPTSSTDDARAAVLAPLTQAREMATKLGIDWKQTWGLKRFRAAFDEYDKVQDEPEVEAE